MVVRIQDSLHMTAVAALPIKMFVAGGTAVHIYTGERVSRAVDAVFSHRIALPEKLDIAYRDADGAARLLYFDRQYNDSFALMHEDAQQDSIALTLEGIDPCILEVRLLTPLDLVINKISRFSDQDRGDIAALARIQGVQAVHVRERARQPLSCYVGSIDRVRGSIELACRIVEDAGRSK